MCHPRDVAAAVEEELQREPHEEHDPRLYLTEPHEDREEQREDLRSGNHTRYAPITPAIAPDAPITGTVLTGVQQDLAGSGEDAGEHVEEQVQRPAEAVLDVVPEDPQEQHVEAEVQPSAVQEHRRDHREVDVLVREERRALGVVIAGRRVALQDVSPISLIVSGRPWVSSHGIAAYSRSKRISLSMLTVPVRTRTTSVPRNGSWTKRNTATLIAMSRIVATGRRRVGRLSRRGITVERPYRGRWSIACWFMAQLDAIRKYLEAGMAFTQTTRAKAEEVVGNLVRAGELQTEQTQQQVQELVERSRENTDRVVKAMREEVVSQMGSLGFATKTDLARLERKVDAMKSSAGAKKAPAKKAAKKSTAKKSTAKKSTAKKAPAKKAAAKKS